MQFELPQSHPLRRETAESGGTGESSEMPAVCESLRASHGLTVETLFSGISGFSKVYLSKIENRQEEPSSAALTRIASCLNEEIGRFFAPVDTHLVSIVYRSDRLHRPILREYSALGSNVLRAVPLTSHCRRLFFTFPSNAGITQHFQHPGKKLAVWAGPPLP